MLRQVASLEYSPRQKLDKIIRENVEHFSLARIINLSFFLSFFCVRSIMSFSPKIADRRRIFESAAGSSRISSALKDPTL